MSMTEQPTGDVTTLDDARMRRAMRQLQRSGRRLVQRNTDWAVVSASDTTVFAILTQVDVARLVAENLIKATEGGGHVATSDANGGAGVGVAGVGVDRAAESPELIPRTGEWVFDAMGYARRKQSGRGFASLATRAQAGEGPFTLRQVMAGLRLIADAEQGLRGDRLGMSWSGLVVDGQRRRGRDGGLAFAARRAGGRIERLRKEMGDAFPLVWSACVERASIRSLARARRVKGREVQHRLSLALEKLAAAYDGVNAVQEA